MPGRITEKITPPSQVEMIPAGRFVSRDGRVSFDNDDPDAVIASTEALRMTGGLPIDYEHASEFADGSPAPAAGWIKNLRNQSGAVIADIEWTPAGADAVSSCEYVFLAPVFRFSKDKVPRVQTLLRAGLTNNPFPALRAALVSIGDYAIALFDPANIARQSSQLGVQRMAAKLTDLERAICSNTGVSELKFITARQSGRSSGEGGEFGGQRAVHAKRADQRLSEIERAICANVGVSASKFLVTKMSGGIIEELLNVETMSDGAKPPKKVHAGLGLFRAIQEVEEALDGLDARWAKTSTTQIAGEAVDALQRWIKSGDEDDYTLPLQAAVLAVEVLAKIVSPFVGDDDGETHSKRADLRLSEVERAICANTNTSERKFIAAKLSGRVDVNASSEEDPGDANLGLIRAIQTVENELNGLDDRWVKVSTAQIATEAVDAFQQWIKAGADEDDFTLPLQGTVFAFQTLAKIVHAYVDDHQ